MQSVHGKHIRTIPVLILGATSIAAQVQFLREFMNIFYGNELSMGIVLAVWLVWTGTGSMFSALTPAGNNARRRFGTGQFLVTGLIPLTFLLIRAARYGLGASHGEIPGLVSMLLSALVVFAPFCLANGFLFPLGIRMLSGPYHGDRAPGRVYLLEAAGAGLGGLAASLLLIRAVSGGTLLLCLSALNLTGAFFLQNRRKQIWGAAGFAGLILALICGPGLDDLGDRILWQSRTVLKTVNSIYGMLALTAGPDQVSLYQNGLHAFSIPDRRTVESSVHYGLLQHPSPRTVLLIGGGLSGIAKESLTHPSVEQVDVIEPDRRLVALMRPYVDMNDPRIRIIPEDGRAWLSETDRRYDAILLNLPNPYTAQLNRFYTREFFIQVRDRLRPSGVFTLQLTGSENLIGPELARFLASIEGTLRSVFPNTITLPGGTVHMIGGREDAGLTVSASELSRRIRERNLDTAYIQPYYLAFDLSPERIRFFQDRIDAVENPQINRDLKPVGFYFDTVLWATHFSMPVKRVYEGLKKTNARWILLAAGGVLIALFAGVRNRKRTVSFSIVSVGFTEISLEFLLILMFQIRFGHVYPQLAWIVASYMAGLGFGAWMQQTARPGKPAFQRFIKIQTAMTILPGLLAAVFHWMVLWPVTPALKLSSTLLFLAALFFAGWIGGAQFVLATRYSSSGGVRPDRTAGSLYGLDLFGSAAGALGTSGFLVPLLGVTQTLVCLSALNLITLVLLAFAAGRNSE